MRILIVATYENCMIDQNTMFTLMNASLAKANLPPTVSAVSYCFKLYAIAAAIVTSCSQHVVA
jgi:hypothetical protein